MVHGNRGSAVLLGADFYGVNLASLTGKEWQQHKKQRGSILLHELIHVYDSSWYDDYILSNWSGLMFTSGTLPDWGGSHWISVWIHNDCEPVDPTKPGVFW